MQIEMYENYCCGGGHCGPLPGYDFACPQCGLDSYAQTGEPLNVRDTFSCVLCQANFQVLRTRGDNDFEVQLMEATGSKSS